MNNNIYVLAKGQLGNQMFEYAMARSLSLSTGGKPVMIRNQKGIELDCFTMYDDLQLSDVPEHTFLTRIGYWLAGRIVLKYNLRKNFEQQKKHNWWLGFFGVFFCEMGFVKPYPLLMWRKTVHCNGYFQSEGYFKKHKDIILRDFTFKKSIKEKCSVLVDKIRNENSVCVHIRLGDYLDPKYAHFKVTDKTYFENAISYIKQHVNNPHFYVFTDSPAIFEKEYKTNDMELIPESYTSQESMYIGSNCKHHIMSNSSFSWWMQYLGQHVGQIVIAPKRWYTDNEQVSEGIYDSRWIKM